MTVPVNVPADLHEPPTPTQHVLIVGGVGVGLCLVALLVGLATGAPRRGFDPHWADGLRVSLSVLGLLIAGCSVSMRPSWFGGWLCAAAAGLLGYGFGGSAPVGTEWQTFPPRDWIAALPNSWDSFHIFFGVGAVIGLIGAAWTRLPLKATVGLIMFGVAFHFAGILSAITSPPATPFLTEQYWNHVSRPYLQFTYMSNAYQFYSPNPGPACEIWVCLEYEGDPDLPKDCEWIEIPKRGTDVKDPLGLSYYRRLSLTENTSQFGTQIPDWEEHQQVVVRRNVATRDIPRAGRSDEFERNLPNEIVINHLLPSYARHFASMHADPSKKLKSVRIYRTLHQLPTLNEFRGYDPVYGRSIDPIGPYSHRLYLPFFQGEFNANGELIDPLAPLLYWLVPIMPERPVPADKAEYKRNGGFSYYYTDYVSKHAGCPRPIKEEP
jgi:hypothetical protein